MALFENQTPESIRSRVLSRMETELQTREGSYSYDMASPLCFELWRMMMTLGELISAFYVDETSGKYLDAHAQLLGMTRRQGTKATAEISFTGTDGTAIPAGTAFYTAAGLEYLLLEEVVIAEGTGAGTVEAAAVGDAYNTDEGEICQIRSNISGLSTYVGGAASGGSDAESDAALYERIVYRRTYPSTSGNESHYIEWALSCDGVGAVKVTKLWNGPGTVRVLIVGYDYGPVDSELVTACAEHIETLRPVGAEVTVVSAAAEEISVTAELVIDSTTTAAAVTAAFRSALSEYLGDVVSDYFSSREVQAYPVYYNRIAALLMGISGVTDYSGLLVCGGTENIQISGTSVPVTGEVDLTCS